MNCGKCNKDTPAGSFCINCGSELSEEIDAKVDSDTGPQPKSRRMLSLVIAFSIILASGLFYYVSTRPSRAIPFLTNVCNVVDDEQFRILLTDYDKVILEIRSDIETAYQLDPELSSEFTEIIPKIEKLSDLDDDAQYDLSLWAQAKLSNVFSKLLGNDQESEIKRLKRNSNNSGDLANDWAAKVRKDIDKICEPYKKQS